MNPEFDILPCTKDHIKTIVDGINTYNLSKVAALSDTWTPLEFVATNAKGEALGGILAGINYWNGLEIKILWVKDASRKQGIGSQLLTYVETMATEKGATMAMVDTFDFQAEEFYLKNEYTIIGEIKNFPKGHRRIYFSKEL